MADTLRALPVQHDGRVMPLDTLAREMVWEITGSSSWKGEDPTATFTGWLFTPDAGANAPVVKVGSSAFAREIGLPAGTTHASFMALVKLPKLMQMVKAARQAQAEDRPRTGPMADAEAIDKRLGLMQITLQQQMARPIPVPGNPRAGWNLPSAVSAETFTALATGPRSPEAGLQPTDGYGGPLQPAAPGAPGLDHPAGLPGGLHRCLATAEQAPGPGRLRRCWWPASP